MFIWNVRFALDPFPHQRKARYFSALEEAPASHRAPCGSPGSVLSFLSAVWNIPHMLNQANGDRQILAKQLNISPHQLSYVTHSGEGEGLLFFGNVILPFVDHFPKDLELYRILTTRLSEVVEAKHE